MVGSVSLLSENDSPNKPTKRTPLHWPSQASTAKASQTIMTGNHGSEKSCSGQEAKKGRRKGWSREAPVRAQPEPPSTFTCLQDFTLLGSHAFTTWFGRTNNTPVDQASCLKSMFHRFSYTFSVLILYDFGGLQLEFSKWVKHTYNAAYTLGLKVISHKFYYKEDMCVCMCLCMICNFHGMVH